MATELPQKEQANFPISDAVFVLSKDRKWIGEVTHSIYIPVASISHARVRPHQVEKDKHRIQLRLLPYENSGIAANHHTVCVVRTGTSALGGTTVIHEKRLNATGDYTIMESVPMSRQQAYDFVAHLSGIPLVHSEDAQPVPTVNKFVSGIPIVPPEDAQPKQ